MLRVCSWDLLRRSLKRSEAIAAIKKQPSVMTSSNQDCWDRILSSQAARTARGMGVASERSNCIRVWDLRKSETVWLWRAILNGRTSLSAIQRKSLICVIIGVLDGLESFRLLKWSEACRWSSKNESGASASICKWHRHQQAKWFQICR